MNPHSTNLKYSQGFSLVEMMLAMLVGLIILAGVMQVYVSSRATQRSSDDQLTLLADARFAIETIAYDLRHTGLWGRHNTVKAIACQKGGADSIPCPAGGDLPTATNDCAAEEYINLARPLFAIDNSAVNPYAATCTNQGFVEGTDVLSLRYADSNRLDDGVLAAGVAYIRTTSGVGQLFIGADFPATDYNELVDVANPAQRKYSNHLLISRAYYVSDYTDTPGDGWPSLRRSDLAVGPAMTSDVLLPGVEDFQLEFGVDVGTNGVKGEKDGLVDGYVNASGVTDTAGPPEIRGWSNGEVQSVRIWLLIRTERKDKDDISSAQTFTIAGNTVTKPNDGYRRHLVTSVVKLRNTFQIDLKAAGN